MHMLDYICMCMLGGKITIQMLLIHLSCPDNLAAAVEVQLFAICNTQTMHQVFA